MLYGVSVPLFQLGHLLLFLADFFFLVSHFNALLISFCVYSLTPFLLLTTGLHLTS